MKNLRSRRRYGPDGEVGESIEGEFAQPKPLGKSSVCVLFPVSCCSVHYLHPPTQSVSLPWSSASGTGPAMWPDPTGSTYWRCWRSTPGGSSTRSCRASPPRASSSWRTSGRSSQRDPPVASDRFPRASAWPPHRTRRWGERNASD